MGNLLHFAIERCRHGRTPPARTITAPDPGLAFHPADPDKGLTANRERYIAQSAAFTPERAAARSAELHRLRNPQGCIAAKRTLQAAAARMGASEPDTARALRTLYDGLRKGRSTGAALALARGELLGRPQPLLRSV